MVKKKNEKKLREQVGKEAKFPANVSSMENEIADNPDLVDELIDGRWTMDEEEFDQKYSSLNSSDMFKVASATIVVSPFLEDDIFSGRSQWSDDDDYYDDDDYGDYDDDDDDDYGDYDDDDYDDHDDDDIDYADDDFGGNDYDAGDGFSFDE